MFELLLRLPTYLDFSAFLVMLTLAWSVYSHYKSKARKELSYENYGARTFDESGYFLWEAGDKGVLVSIENSGTEEIGPDDYLQELCIDYGKTAEVRCVFVTTRPTEMKVDRQTNGGQLTLKPDILNPGDMMAVFSIIEGYETQPVVRGRVRGISEIKPFKSLTDGCADWFVAGGLVAVLLSLVLTLLGWRGLGDVLDDLAVLLCGVSIALNTVFLLGLYHRYRRFPITRELSEDAKVHEEVMEHLVAEQYGVEETKDPPQ